MKQNYDRAIVQAVDFDQAVVDWLLVGAGLLTVLVAVLATGGAA